jgi:hypothetical protein
MTDQPESLDQALAQLQASLPHIGKDKTARVVTKEKGTYTYAYANLASISAEVLPLLAGLGLSFTACPDRAQDGAFVLRYRLRHVSGDGEGGEYPLPDPARTTPQQVGSAITYARRYCLCAVTGIAADEDDDGQAAATARQRRPRAATAREPLGEPPPRDPSELPRNQDGSISRSQATDEELAAAGVMTSAQVKEHTRLRKDAQEGAVNGVTRSTAADPDDEWQDVPRQPLRTPRAAMSPSQAIPMHFTRLGFKPAERQQRLNATAALAGRESITSTNDLTAAEGGRVLKALSGCKDRGALVALMNGETVDA